MLKVCPTPDTDSREGGRAMQIHGTWAILEGTGVPLNVRNQAGEAVIVLDAEMGVRK